MNPAADQFNEQEAGAIPQPEEGTFFVKLLTGKNIMFQHNPTLTVREVKEAIFGSEQIPVDQQRLVFHGKQLEDNHNLQYYEITRDSTLHLVLRLRGGF